MTRRSEVRISRGTFHQHSVVKRSIGKQIIFPTFSNPGKKSWNKRKEKVHYSKENTVNCLCIGLNIQGLNPSPNSKSGWKIQKLREEIDLLQENNFHIPFVALVETWLRPEIADAQININGFNIFRQDRDKVQHGGVLLYINNKISIDNSSYYNDDQCSAVICVSKKSKCIICNVYRPPTTTDSSFSNLLNFIRNFIQLYNVLDKLQLFIFGDFNLPNFCWDNFGKSTCSIPTGFLMLFFKHLWKIIFYPNM